MVITRKNAIHALIYLILSLFSVAFIFVLLGAPFVAALEVLVYAGAIMVLFIFVIMILNPDRSHSKEKLLIQRTDRLLPLVLSSILLAELIYTLGYSSSANSVKNISPKEVAISLFQNYLPIIELGGFLLMVGIVGAYHLGKKENKIFHRYLSEKNDN